MNEKIKRMAAAAIIGIGTQVPERTNSQQMPAIQSDSMETRIADQSFLLSEKAASEVERIISGQQLAEIFRASIQNPTSSHIQAKTLGGGMEPESERIQASFFFLKGQQTEITITIAKDGTYIGMQITTRINGNIPLHDVALRGGEIDAAYLNSKSFPNEGILPNSQLYGPYSDAKGIGAPNGISITPQERVLLERLADGIIQRILQTN